tara:strand:+ start:615 stop:830 length:216 start_codon:yes stop_codon:yes gene_type:complete
LIRGEAKVINKNKMIKYISIVLVLLLLFIVATSVSITDKIIMNSGNKVTQDEITHIRNSYILDKNKNSIEH